MSLTEADLLTDIRQRLFSSVHSAVPQAVGIELELIPFYRESRKAVLIRDERARTDSSRILSRLAAREGWLARANGDDPGSWILPEKGAVSFEPGGQLEISGAPRASASSAIQSMQVIVTSIRDEMSRDGIDLLASGVDPYNDISTVPLQLTRDRYTRMNRFFDSIGSSGARMMRQTAALQINLERGPDPQARWRLLNALAPVAIALFANSTKYAGQDTGWASYRSCLWRTLDDSRTGLPYSEDAAQGYLDFALDALAIKCGDSEHRSFRELMRSDEIDHEDWIFHLSTLFPEVRPREYFELRAVDTIEPESLAAPILFLTGLIYEQSAAEKAATLLGQPDAARLETAARMGLKDPGLRKLAATLVDISLDAGTRLGKDFISESDLQIAADYFARKLIN